MGANLSINNLDSSSLAGIALRKLIYCLTVIAVSATTAGPINLMAQVNDRIPRHAPMPPELQAEAVPAVPTPQYVPPGYVFNGAYRGEPDGFRTGKSEIKFAYLNLKVFRSHIWAPLFVFVSPMTDNFFGGTEDHAPELLRLRIGVVTVEARYFDGCWKPTPDGERILANGKRATWDASNLNSLVFPFDGYMIGIVGSKQGGVGRGELIKIAKSLTYTKR
jgi:hypothetical protein